MLPLIAATGFGLLMAMLCYVSLFQTAGRGSSAAVVVYRWRALAASAAIGLLSGLTVAAVAELA